MKKSQLVSIIKEVFSEMAPEKLSEARIKVSKSIVAESKLRASLKSIILSEIQRADYGVGKPSSNSDLIDALNKALHSAAGEKATAKENPLNNKITFDDGANGAKFQVEIVHATDAEDGFNITAVLHGSDRYIAKNVSREDVIKFIKDELKEKIDDKSYVGKAKEKGKAPIDKDDKSEKKIAKKEEKPTDKMEDSKESSQKDIADKSTPSAEEDVEIEDITPALGGELMDKIEKIIDRVLKNKNKSDAKTSFLKADSDMESPDKLTVKDKGTPKLKEKKS